jgi:hypothetical protein
VQNLYIVHGNPGWSSKFLIACFNQSGKFSALRYEFDKDKAGKAIGCRAWTIEKVTGEKLVGATITLEMAQSEGWSTKSGSKWKTMPEQMLMYRAASFFVRTYAPEISMGLQTTEELSDGIYEAPEGSVRTIADLQTGEVPPPTSGQPTPTFETYLAQLNTAADQSIADLVMDEARSLPAADYDKLAEAYQARFGN